jgi:hypothetical protein
MSNLFGEFELAWPIDERLLYPILALAFCIQARKVKQEVLAMWNSFLRTW